MLVLARRGGGRGNGWVDEWTPESANAIGSSVRCRVRWTRTRGMTYKVSTGVSCVMSGWFYAMTQPECSDVLVLSESMRTSSTAGSSTGTGEEIVKNASMADELSWRAGWGCVRWKRSGSSLRKEEEVLEWARLLSVDGNGQLSPSLFNLAPRELVWMVPGTGHPH